MIMLTKVLALEVEAYGVRVNCICPESIRQRGTTDEQLKKLPLTFQ
jgi:NAD(P)-dependent dehydrogenase (short-subunit alcohol dehydrogenase family)